MYVIEHRGSTPLTSTIFYMKNFKHAIIYVGSRKSGKISRNFLTDIKKLKIRGTKSFLCQTPDDAVQLIEKLNLDDSYKKVYIILLYCEDDDIAIGRAYCNVIDLGNKIETTVSQQTNRFKFKIIHRTEIGRILGNKLETNKFLTKAGVPFPKIITDPNYDKPIFTNLVNGSRNEKAGMVQSAANLNNKTYNTEYIDTTYEYLGKTYFVSPRVFCIGTEITHFIIRCSSTKKNDVVVRTPWDVTYEEAPGLQYDFFKTQIVPNYEKIKEMCKRAGDAFGFGAYCYDLLRDVKNDKWYVSEAMFKFDSAGSVRLAPYSIITYRQIQKEVYGKVFDNDAEMEALENVPLGVKEWYTKKYMYKSPQGKFKWNAYYLPKKEYHNKVNSVTYWIMKIYKQYFESIYNYRLEKIYKNEKS